MADGESAEWSVADLAERNAAGEVQIVDVRTEDEWAEGTIAGSRKLNFNELTRAADSLDREQPVVFVCASGNRSATAAEAFRIAGFDAASLAGGIDAWREQGQELDQS